MNSPSIVIDQMVNKCVVIELFGQTRNPFPIAYSTGSACGTIAQPALSWKDLQQASGMIFHHFLPQFNSIGDQLSTWASIDVVVMLTPGYDIQYFDQTDSVNSKHFGKDIIRANVISLGDVDNEDRPKQELVDAKSDHMDKSAKPIDAYAAECEPQPEDDAVPQSHTPPGYAAVTYYPFGLECMHAIELGAKMTFLPRVRNSQLQQRYLGDYINDRYIHEQVFTEQRYDSSLVSYGYHADVPVLSEDEPFVLSDFDSDSEMSDSTDDEFSGYETNDTEDNDVDMDDGQIDV